MDTALFLQGAWGDTHPFQALTNAFDAVEELYTPDARLWFNVTGREISREESLEVLRKGVDLHRRRTYDDRTIQTFDGGFVVQYSVNVVLHDGRRASLWACLVAECRDGRIARLDEYLDSGKFRPRGEAAHAAGAGRA